MKILLNLFIGQEFERYPFNEYPIGLLSLAEYARARLSAVEFRVFVGPLTVEQVETFGPDLIGISALTPYFTKATKAIEQIKHRFPALPIILGGHHISYLPNNLPSTVDVGVLGEGEVTFFELCQLLLAGKPLAAENLSTLTGIVFRDKVGNLIETPRRKAMPVEDIPVIKNFDLCRFAFDKPLRFNVITSRGCPYRCRFCSSSPFWGAARYYTVQNTVDQIEYIAQTYHPEMIHIADDLMVANYDRLKLIRDQIVERGIHKIVCFECWVSGNHFTESTAQLLKDMHVILVCIAIESGSPAIYKFLKGSWNTPRQTAAAMRLARRLDMAVSMCVIVGSPPETVNDLKSTYKFLKQVPFECGLVFILKALPGTRLWVEAKQRGLVSDTMADWAILESDDVLDPKTIFLGEKATREQVHKYYVKIGELINQKPAEREQAVSWTQKLQNLLCFGWSRE